MPFETCYDCKQTVSDFVMEKRQVSGGDGVVYAGDFQPRPVCANRRVCNENKLKAAAEKKFHSSCKLCGLVVTYTEGSKAQALSSHIQTHTIEEIAVMAYSLLFSLTFW